MASRVCAEKRVRVACIIQDRAFGRVGETADKVIFGEDGREVMNVDLVRLRHRLRFLFLCFLALYGVDLQSSPPGLEMSLEAMVTGNELNGEDMVGDREE